MIEEIFKSTDNEVRTVKVRTKTGMLERVVQHLYPLELMCDQKSGERRKQQDAKPVNRRPKRNSSTL